MRAQDQLNARSVFLFTSKEAQLWEPTTPPFGQDMTLSFSTIEYDALEASKCLVIGRSTAAAFHSIRCLEAGIRAIARCLAIPDPTKAADRSWFKSLKAIKDEIDRRWPSTANRTTGDGHFFEEAHAALAAMQNPWRNATMHLDQKYTEEEANYIFTTVREFMKKIAVRCNENGEPKA